MRTLASARIAWVGLALALVLMALALRAPTLSQPLLEAHGFRQTQTAYTALMFHENGIDLLRPKLPILGQTYDVPLEFPLFQALGALIMGIGVSPDTAMRVSGLLCFALTAVFLWLLVRRVAGPVAAGISVVTFVFSPFGLLWSRTSLIEYLATACALGAAWAALTWRDEGSRPLYAAALVLGVVAMLVKPTTALFWMAPAFLYVAAHDRPGIRGWLGVRLRPAMVALFVLPLASAFLWTAYADSVKARDFATAFLTGSTARELVFGVPEQRFNVDEWRTILGRIKDYLVGTALIPVLALAAWSAIRGRQRWFWAGVAIAIVFPILTFFDLYVHHDYYLAAVSAGVAAFVGLGCASLIDRARGRTHLAATVAVLLLAAATTIGSARAYWTPIYRATVDPEGVLPRARELAALTRPEDRVVVLGRSYNADLLYYARRKGQMMSPYQYSADFFATLPARGYQVIYTWNEPGDPVFIARNWAWNGALGARTYVLGQSAAEMRDARVLATDDEGAFARAARSGKVLLTEPRTVPCGTSILQIPNGPDGTWITITGTPAAPDTRVRIGFELAPLPIRGVYFVAPEYVDRHMLGGPIQIGCTKGPLERSIASSITVRSVVAGGPPR